KLTEKVSPAVADGACAGAASQGRTAAADGGGAEGAGAPHEASRRSAGSETRRASMTSRVPRSRRVEPGGRETRRAPVLSAREPRNTVPECPSPHGFSLVRFQPDRARHVGC